MYDAPEPDEPLIGGRPILGLTRTWLQPELICKVLYQVGEPHAGWRDHGEVRCAPSAFLGAIILTDEQPPRGLLSVIEDLVRRNDRIFERKQVASLWGIHQRLTEDQATYRDMYTLQQALYEVFGESRTGTWGWGRIFRNLESLGGYKTRDLQSGLSFDQLVDGLAAGDSILLTMDPKWKRKGHGHIIAVGKDRHAKFFLYDPWPWGTHFAVIRRHQREVMDGHLEAIHDKKGRITVPDMGIFRWYGWTSTQRNAAPAR